MVINLDLVLNLLSIAGGHLIDFDYGLRSKID